MISTPEDVSRRSVRWLRWTAMLPAAAAVFFAIIAADRARLPYNSNGRYLDVDNSVVYDEGSVLGYGVSAICCLLLAVALWLGFGRYGQQRGSPVEKDAVAGHAASRRIEYLIRADGGSDWDLIIKDEDVLIPQTGDCERGPHVELLTVLCRDWSVEYSPEDPGWQLWFSEGTPQDEAHEYVHLVAAQLTARTGVATRCVQIS